MGDKNDERNLKRCFQEMIEAIHEAIVQLKPTQSSSQSDVFHKNSVLSTGVYTFTLNKSDEEQLDKLKEKIQSSIDQYRTRLSSTCKRYLFEFLNQFHYNEEKKFSSSFTMDSLHPFECSLRGALDSIDAFAAAWNGDLPRVKEFIQNYPTFKNKPGLHGTTLLYSAARNNHINVVEYLINNAKCAVNAQNLQELEKVLHETTGGGHYSANPSAASTALHGACFNSNLSIVKYLVEHEADYFIRNQAQETPIKNGLSNGDIRLFFQDFLILNYSQTSNSLPDEPLNEKPFTGTFDCIWEYKSLSSKEWNSFSVNDSNELNQALSAKLDLEVQKDIYLRGNSLVSISLTEFLRSTKNEDKETQLSWIRCRGSSSWNFNCHCLWQIMIVEHSNLRSSDTPSLKAFDIPLTDNSKFKLQCNCWYYCSGQISSQIDKAMNYRRKRITVDVDFISDDRFVFDLHGFQFANEQNTICGYIRWIPKFPSKIRHRENKADSGNHVRKVSDFQIEQPNKRRIKQGVSRNSRNTLSDDDDDSEYDENENDIQLSTHLNVDDDNDDDDDDENEDDDQKEVNSSCANSHLSVL